MLAAGRLLAATLVCGSAILLYAVHVRPLAYLPLVLGVTLAWWVDRKLGADLLLIATGMAIVSSISLKADLTNAGIARFGVALSLAVVVPFALSRRWVREGSIRFPWRARRPWTRVHWTYLIAVSLAGYLVLPWYFLSSGVWRNWPQLESPNEIARLFVGVASVGTWDELFFVCTVFALLRRHFTLWPANVLQTLVFVSFLWELGYRSWGPGLTIPFALIQGLTFAKTASLTYVLVVHMLFDAVVFAVVVHAHHPQFFDVFLTAPW
ncbi:type II CAAX prenyl endopeptidase Rce1 family protein [Pengzhenrongella sp.]|uniref:CPBP family glutamic-type intramembrane protease n=1 Tax=Pengzhenrongella sp. TaxID=2888820 RepID=UPI002F95C3A8